MLLCFWASKVYAYNYNLTDSTIHLNMVTTVSQKVQHTFDVKTFDPKNVSGKKLSDYLTELTPIYIKNYGGGQLSTISYRGTSSSQTELLWNGIKLNSPMLGQNDLSLFTNGIQDDISISSGGAIGAQLELKNNTSLDSALVAGNVILRAGSFKAIDVVLNTKYQAGWFIGSTKFAVNNSTNNFSFKNTFKELAPIEKQSHAAYSQLAFFQELTALVDKKNRLSLFFWYTHSNRELPPIMSQSKSFQTQDDEAFRGMVNYYGEYKKLYYKIVSAFINESLWYKDPLANLDSKSSTNAIRNKISIGYELPKNFSLGTNLYYDYELAKTDGYSKMQNRSILGGEVYLRYFDKRNLHVLLNLKEEVNGGKASAFAPRLFVNFDTFLKDKHRLGLFIILERAFRFPTLNDLYWKQGGNPNLKQEKAWKGELKASYRYSDYINLSVSNYYNLVDNWILWHPQSNGIWSPDNVKKVFSRGVETTLQISNDLEGKKKYGVHFTAIYSYTKTTNLVAISTNDDSKGKQLIYVPLHKLNLIAHLDFKGFYIRGIMLFTDKIFTSTDNSEFFKSYFISNLEVGKDFQFQKQQIGISFRINNLTNTQYQIVAQRAMPGRSFEGTIKLNFKN